MSAYLVEPQHITEIVKWASNPQQGNLSHVYNQITKKEIDCDAESLIEILSLANIQSLVARYGEQAEVEYEGYVDKCKSILKYSTDGASFSLLTGVGSCDLKAEDIYNMVRCLEYQSCEVHDWVHTDAYWLLNAIRDKAGSKMSEDANVPWNFGKRGVA
tara:strand:- start:56 stop:532 length:477 start_codon:yes stop_codon:yes gene_type:complete